MMLNEQNTKNFFVAFLLSIFIITLAVKSILNFKYIYYFDIDHLKLSESVSIPNESIAKNYDILIDYLSPYNKNELFLPDFKMSPEGKIHFRDVKALFIRLNYLCWISGLFSVPCLIYLLKKKIYLSLKYTSYLLFFIPSILIIPFIINFQASFEVFHKIFFTNDYWIFDADKDPIINVLPEQFFFHCAIFILLFLVLSSAVSRILYNKLSFKQ